MSSGLNSRVLSPSSLSSSFQFITADRHSEANYLSEESFSSVSDASSSDDDEIVWSVSDELSASVLTAPSTGTDLLSPDIFSDEEFIVLSPAATRPINAPDSGSSSPSASIVESGVEISSVDGLSDVLSNLNIDSEAESVRPVSQATTRRQRRNARRAKVATSVAPPVTAQVPSATTPKLRNTPPRADDRAASTTTTPKKRKARQPKVVKPKSKPQSASSVPPDARAGAGLGERPIVDDVSEVGDVKAAAVYEDAAQYIST